MYKMYKSNIAWQALSAAVVGLIFMTAAFAQQQGRIRGQIEKIDGMILSVKTRDGTTLTVKLSDHARVSALVKASLAEIKTDSFIGVAGMPQPDGSIQAFSIHIFLPAQRGVVPDRHGPWDARPGSTMTNAYVESTIAAKDGETLTVKYKDGEKKIVVTPQTVIAAVAPRKKEDLRIGAQVIVFAWDKQPDGSVLAKSMYVGRDVAPAM
jgi:outer membrane lipoprotein SlyB